MVYSLDYGVAQERKNRYIIAAGSLITAALLTLGLVVMPALAEEPNTAVVVSPSDTQGWAQTDTPGGSTTFVADGSAPLGSGALQLATNGTDPAKANYMHAANTPLSAVTDLSYATKQVTASSPSGSASYQLAVDTNGSADGGFTTLVYEPYWQNDKNPDAAPVVANTWQTWDVDSGYFWSSKTVGGLTAGGGGAPFYTLAEVRALNPDAVVVGFGVNVGTYNRDYTVNVDAVRFNQTTYNFEQIKPKPVAATDKEQCKNGGWMNFQTAYKNQGECVSSTVPKEKTANQR